MLFFFFFQAEDGIRDRDVTGVQTCALPICLSGWRGNERIADSIKKGPPEREREDRSEEHTSELQSHHDLVCRLLLEKKKKKKKKLQTPKNKKKQPKTK